MCAYRRLLCSKGIDIAENTFVVLALLAIALLIVGACETPVEDMTAPTEVPSVAAPMSQRGIGVSRAEMQAVLEEEPFGFTFNPLSHLSDGSPKLLGYSLEEGQEGTVELIGHPGNLTKINFAALFTGASSHTSLSRLTEVAFRSVPHEEREEGAELWVVEHIPLALEEGSQSARFDDICMQMKWFDNLHIMTLVVERCAP